MFLAIGCSSIATGAGGGRYTGGLMGRGWATVGGGQQRGGGGAGGGNRGGGVTSGGVVNL